MRSMYTVACTVSSMKHLCYGDKNVSGEYEFIWVSGSCLGSSLNIFRVTLFPHSIFHGHSFLLYMTAAHFSFTASFDTHFTSNWISNFIDFLPFFNIYILFKLKKKAIKLNCPSWKLSEEFSPQLLIENFVYERSILYLHLNWLKTTHQKRLSQ